MVLNEILSMIGMGASEGAQETVKTGDAGAGVAEASEEMAEEATGKDVDVPK